MVSTFAVTFVLWTCVALIVLSYVVYPFVVWAVSRSLGPPAKPPEIASADWPCVSLLIAAHNEEDVIEGRIQNALAMDYPRDRLEIVIALDGCDDRTAAIVRHYEGGVVRMIDYPLRRGKSAVLNATFDGLTGEIVMLSDANTEIDPQAARHLTRWFRDPQVGAVCGRLVLADPHTGRNADSLYWRYETFLKHCEGRIGALLGANGAIYAIRKDLFQPIPDRTIIDDFVIPLLAKLRSGCSLIYDPSAIAREETPTSVKSEFRRRTRIGAGGFQSMGLLWRLLDPRRGWIAFAFLSHKVLRWLCPFLMISAFVCNLLVLDIPLYRMLLMAQISFYAASALAAFLPSSVIFLKPLRLATMFTSMNLALYLGFWRWLLWEQNGIWERTGRSPAERPVRSDSSIAHQVPHVQ